MALGHQLCWGGEVQHHMLRSRCCWSHGPFAKYQESVSKKDSERIEDLLNPDLHTMSDMSEHVISQKRIYSRHFSRTKLPSQDRFPPNPALAVSVFPAPLSPWMTKDTLRLGHHFQLQNPGDVVVLRRNDIISTLGTGSAICILYITYIYSSLVIHLGQAGKFEKKNIARRLPYPVR